MKQQTFHQSISIFTMRIWLHYNGLRGDTRHSYLNDFASDIRQVNHFTGHRSLMNLIKEYRMNKAFKNVLVYDNINNVPVYDEVFVPSANTYRIRLNCTCKFYQDEKGNFFYQGYETYEQETGELVLVQADPDLVRVRAKNAFEYVRKRKSMPGIVHPQSNEVSIQQGRGQENFVGLNLEQLRSEKLLQGLTPSQYSQVADFLLKMKGQAA